MSFITALQNSRTLVLSLVAVAGLLIAAAIWHLTHNTQTPSETYLTAKVEQGTIENLVTATGILQPRDYVDVGAQVSGQLKKLYVEVGSQVKAGDLLAEIDATVYKAKVEGIRAQLKSQQAQLKDKIAQNTLAAIQVQRQQNLHKDDATTLQNVQTAQAAFESAQAQQEMLEAQIAQTQSSLKVEEANLTYAKIYAPMDGTVVSITSRQGQTLNANQMAPTIMRVADLTTMTVQAQVSEADIGQLHPGMPVYFTTLGGQNNRWDSVLNQIQPTPEITNNVVLYDALFDVPNSDHRLMTQMSAQVFFIAASAKDVLVIPAAALSYAENKSNAWKEKSGNGNWDKNKKSTTSDDKKLSADHAQQGDKSEHSHGNKKPTFVEIINSEGKIERRKITLGISNRVQAQVLEGLAVGDEVVTGLRQAKKPSTKPPMGAGSTPGMGGGGFR